MKFRIAPQVCEKIPGLRVAIIVLKGIQNIRKLSTPEQLLSGVCAQRKTEWKNDAKYKKVTELIEKTRIEDQMLPESHLFESMVRKIKRGRPPVGKSNLHSVLTYIMVKYLVPLQAYDLDEVEKDIIVDLKPPLKGARADEIFVSKETKSAVMWFVDVGGQSKDEFTDLPAEFAALVQKYCGGISPDIHILNCDAPEVDLNYESDKEKEYKAAHPENDKNSFEESIPASPTQTEGEKREQSGPSVKELLKAAVKHALGSAGIEESAEIEIETPADPTHGDYATSLPLKLSKTLGKAPHEVAQTIIQALPTLDFIEKAVVAGPGFINFHLSQRYFEQELNSILEKKEKFGRINIGEGKKVLVEYSQPNIAKPLGVHHLLSTILGQAIADLHRASGYETVSLNYLGDWGTQFGKLLYAYKNWGDLETVKQNPLNELLKLYVQFHEAAEKDPALEDRGREEFKKLEEGDEENTKLWNWFREVSLEEVQRIYKKLNIQFDEYLGEAMYREKTPEILDDGKKKGVFIEGEKGAIIVKFENEKYPPFMVQKADGATLYSTRDLASIRDRLDRYHPDKIVYVVDVAQKLHFQQLFETARMLGLSGAELVHVDFGRMQLPEGKMSTRKGDVVLLDEVIREAVERTRKIVEEKSRELSPEEQQKVAEGMAIGAVKYNIFTQNRETNITFDWDRMLSLEGNSAPYLQYAYARAQSILRKAGYETASKSGQLKMDPQTSLFSVEEEQKAEAEKEMRPFGDKTEQTLLRLLPLLPEKIELAVRDYKPNVLTAYLYDVARAFSSFYNEVHVLGASRPDLREARLRLVRATAQVLKNGLQLLRIQVFERM